MKTHSEKLNELTNAIRQSIPRLMELSEGCEIITQSGTKYKIYLEETLWYNCFNEKAASISITKPIDKHSIFTIGHEPLLNDVLEWMDKSVGCWSYIYGQHTYIRELMTLYDLTKSNLKDQSHELIDFLHELI